MKTLVDLQEWAVAVADAFGDPSAKTCQIFARFVREDDRMQGGEVLASWEPNGQMLLWLGGDGMLPLPIADDGPSIDDYGVIAAYGLENIDNGLWALVPSLNVPGVIHAFVTIYDVPHPAPWESRIVVVQSIGRF